MLDQRAVECQSTSVTITRTGFGTAPTLSVTGSGVALTLNSASPDGTTIQATATVNATAPSQSVTVQVTPGYTGNSFTCNCQGQSPNGTDTATIQPIAPPPQIMFNSQTISGTTQTVLAGQKIVLSVATASGYTIQSQSWSFSNQSAITGGFWGYVNGECTPGTQPSASAGGCEAADPPLNQNSLTFYWVNPGDNGETVTCNYTLTNGASASATATFNIQGPTDVQVATPTNPVVVGIIFGVPTMQFGADRTDTPGITFSATADGATSGTFEWVQFISQDLLKFMQPSGMPPPQISGPMVCRPLPLDDDPTHPVLDADYPYYAETKPPLSISDSPNLPLSSLAADGEAAVTNFTATMYLMWDPTLGPSGCTAAHTNDVTNSDGSTTTTDVPSTCTSIPVPIGSIPWSWHGCSVNTLTNQTNGTQWVLDCPSGGPSGSFQSGGYPQWTQTQPSGKAVQIQCEQD